MRASLIIHCISIQYKESELHFYSFINFHAKILYSIEFILQPSQNVFSPFSKVFRNKRSFSAPLAPLRKFPLKYLQWHPSRLLLCRLYFFGLISRHAALSVVRLDSLRPRIENLLFYITFRTFLVVFSGKTV